MWIYSQQTGEIFHNNELAGSGYSGFGPDKNCPASQPKHNKGPIPRGLYQILAPQDTLTHGPYALPLAPHLTNQMFARNAFLIHGDSEAHPGTASEGCVILGRPIRERIWESGDRDLKVVAEVMHAEDSGQH